MISDLICLQKNSTETCRRCGQTAFGQSPLIAANGVSYLGLTWQVQERVVFFRPSVHFSFCVSFQNFWRLCFPALCFPRKKTRMSSDSRGHIPGTHRRTPPQLNHLKHWLHDYQKTGQFVATGIFSGRAAEVGRFKWVTMLSPWSFLSLLSASSWSQQPQTQLLQHRRGLDEHW